MQGDTAAAVDFLREFYPKGPWLLTSIDPDKKGIETETFTLETVDDMVVWLDRWNGRRNIYFSVNPPIRALHKKAERTDIKWLCYLHVDVDPRAGEDLLEEQQRALALCTEKLPAGVPQPTFVVFSGGGYQAFWRLEDPVRIDGDLELAEDAKLYNVQLERLFGADNCHNIDRIMRVPGTVNIPDAKKRKKGRVEALARVVEHAGRRYPLSDFVKAQPVQVPGVSGLGGSNSSAVKVEVSGNVARLDSVDDLDPWNVPDRVRVAIVQGSDPDNPKKGDNSRSGWLFDVCCNLVRCDVPDEVVYSIITDPDFLISESVLDKGSNSERYALRTIARAKEEAIDPALRELNERFAVIENWGGKCRVIEEVADDAYGGRPRLTKQSFEDFRNRFMNRQVQIGTDDKGRAIFKQLGKFWLEHPQRKQYLSIVFQPGRETTESYNMWRGFGVEARPGDCGLFLEHVRGNICSGNEGYFAYLMGWMARAVQHPATSGQVAVVLRGGQGTGKSFFAKAFGHLFGRHFLPISNSGHLVGNFNAHLRDSVVLFADEAFYAGDKRHESVLKTLITEETLAIEAKGVDVEVSPNYTHIIMASNNTWVVPAGADERRYFVLDVGDGHKQDSTYFQAIADQLEKGGYQALLHALVGWDLSSFNVRDVPKTGALAEQKALSLAPEEEWWFRKLEEGSLMEDHSGWQGAVVKGDLFQDYVQYARDYNIVRRGNQTSLGRFLNRVCPASYPISRRQTAKIKSVSADGYQIETAKRLPHYVFPSLGECRRRWDEMYGVQPWGPEPEGVDDPDPQIPF